MNFAPLFQPIKNAFNKPRHYIGGDSAVCKKEFERYRGDRPTFWYTLIRGSHGSTVKEFYIGLAILYVACVHGFSLFQYSALSS